MFTRICSHCISCPWVRARLLVKREERALKGAARPGSDHCPLLRRQQLKLSPAAEETLGPCIQAAMLGIPKAVLPLTCFYLIPAAELTIFSYFSLLPLPSDICGSVLELPCFSSRMLLQFHLSMFPSKPL